VIHGARLYFQYRLAGAHGVSYLRYVDLNAWAAGKQDKYWEPGSSAKGAFWPALWRPGYELDTKTALICEGETDALAAVQFGAGERFPMILSVPGAHTLAVELFDKLIEFDYQLVLAFDRDPAGDSASERAAWLVADRRPLNRLVYPDGVNDLRDCLLRDVAYSYDLEQVAQVPQVQTAPPVPAPPSWKRPPQSDTHEKPDLLRVWHSLGLRTRHPRKDGKGRSVLQAWCPVHEDGTKPGAWVGADKWGCFVCGIESADVFELVAWVRGYAQPGDRLAGDAFTRARDDARSLAP
jgi:hypothetical protein